MSFLSKLALFCAGAVEAWNLEETARNLARAHTLNPKAMRSTEAWMHARGANMPRRGGTGGGTERGGQPGRRGMRQHFRVHRLRAVWCPPDERFAGEPQFRHARKLRDVYSTVLPPDALGRMFAGPRFVGDLVPEHRFVLGG